MKRDDLLVMCGHACVRITCVLGIFDHHAVVLGYLETADSSHQFSTAKYMKIIQLTSVKPICAFYTRKHNVYFHLYDSASLTLISDSMLQNHKPEEMITM